MTKDIVSIESMNGLIRLTEAPRTPEVGSLVMSFFRVKEGRDVAQAGLNPSHTSVCSADEELVGGYTITPGDRQALVELPRVSAYDGSIMVGGKYSPVTQRVVLVADVGYEQGLFSRPNRVDKLPGLNLIVSEQNLETRKIIRDHGFVGQHDLGTRGHGAPVISPPYRDRESDLRKNDMGYYVAGQLRACGIVVGDWASPDLAQPTCQDKLNGF